MSTRKHHKKWFVTMLALSLLHAYYVYGQEGDSISYTFHHTDTTYTFHGRFIVDADAACLLNICFNFEHIKALALDANKVELIAEEENWNKIKYTYKQFPFYRNESLWHRTMDQENARVDFKLISSINNHSFMPGMISSSGYYKVSKKNGAFEVEYFQWCWLTKSGLISLYHYYMKKKAVEFLYLFKDYSRKHCCTTK